MFSLGRNSFVLAALLSSLVSHEGFAKPAIGSPGPTGVVSSRVPGYICFFDFEAGDANFSDTAGQHNGYLPITYIADLCARRLSGRTDFDAEGDFTPSPPYSQCSLFDLALRGAPVMVTITPYSPDNCSPAHICRQCYPENTFL